MIGNKQQAGTTGGKVRMRTKEETAELARLEELLQTTGLKVKMATTVVERFLRKNLAGDLTPAETEARDKATAEGRGLAEQCAALSKAIGEVRSGSWAKEQAGFAKNKSAAAEVAELRKATPELRDEMADLDRKLRTLAKIEAAGGKPLEGIQADDRAEYIRQRAEVAARLARTEKRISGLRAMVIR
jgi:hypothetical protein